MSRLIDADVLKDNIFGYAPPEMMWDRGDIEHKIDEMLTIPAIPVEWLRSQLKNNPNDIESAYDDIFINELIDKWQKEQEAR